MIIIKTTGYAYENVDYGMTIQKKLDTLNVSSKILSAVTDMDTIFECMQEPMIISGGSTGVMENFSWIKDLKIFIRKRITLYPHIPLLGICFGSQIIAEAFDPGCIRISESINAGLTDINCIDEGSIFEHVHKAYAFHFHIITSNQLKVYAKGQLGGQSFVNAYQIPNTSIFGTQFHPEFDSAIYTNLIKYYAPWLEKDFNIQPTDPIIGDIDNKILKDFCRLCYP